MLPGGRGIDGLDRLDVRLVALLGLALLPIGVIAMVQTYRVIDNADDVARQALIGTTLTAVNTERETLVQLRGAAQIAADLIPELLDDPELCSERLSAFVRRIPAVAFAGFVDNAGIVTCASAGVGQDMSGQPVFQRFSADNEAFISSTHGVISQRPVVVVTEPVEIDEEVAGYVALSVPQLPLRIQSDDVANVQPIGTVTVMTSGQIFSTETRLRLEDFSEHLPAVEDYTDWLRGDPANHETEARNGTTHIYTVVPVIPNEIYAMSVWRASAVSTGGLTAASAILFPLLMWVVSIGVAYFAVHRLVVRHIRLLRLRIRAFTTTRRILPYPEREELPSELREVVEAFDQLTERILRDEADLENSLHEKDVLLKEVHHRVKNNLQLISSMMNMQLRKSNRRDTQLILRRLQDRVLGLATIHRNLYRASVLSRVDSARLISDLVEQMVSTSDLDEMGVKIDIDVEPVSLYPDQAVPLSLLVTEALTNAMKNVGRPEDGAPWIELTLSEDDGEIELCCSNSLGTPLQPVEEENIDSGLGKQLMRAFVMQLDGHLDITQDGEHYALNLSFTTSEFAEEQ